MIRILHCVVKLDRGGAETLIMNIYRNVDREKVQFDFLTSLDGEYEQEIADLGGRVYKLPFIDKIGPFAYANNLCDFFKAHPEYKIVHSHMDKFSGMVMKQATKMNVPVRISHSHSTQNEGGLLIQLVKNYYGKMVTKYATHLFACSKKASDWMFGNAHDKALIINNGVDLQVFKCEDKRNNDFFTIGSIARFSTPKNHDFLIDIFNEVYKVNKSARLVLVGEGTLKKQIEGKVSELNLGSVVSFLGSRNDIADILSTFDVFVLPSLFEGVPVSLIEAQAMGVPCIASANITKDINVSGDVSFISLDKSAKQWASEILSHNNLERKNNHKKIEQAGYNIKNTANLLQDFYFENANL